MKTRSQIRAKNALGKKVGKGQKDGNVLSGFGTLVRMDGLLAALAYSCERKKDGPLKHPGEHDISTNIAEHLKDPLIAITSSTTPEELVEELARADGAKLRRATAEALAYLNYLKRLASH